MANLTKVYYLRLMKHQKVLPCSLFTRLYSTDGDIFDSTPIIRFPLGLKRKMIRKTLPKNLKKNRSSLQLAKPGKLLITCDKKSEMMRTNEDVTKFTPPVITSSTWTSRQSPGRHFTIHPIRENPSFKNECSVSFEEMLLSDEILNALNVSNIKTPTVIQEKSIPEILKGKNVMLAAETGSGKTLAYLLPLMQRLLTDKHSQETYTSPRAIVVTPTRELSIQVAQMGAALDLPLKFLSLHTLHSMKYLRPQNSEAMYDIVVGTPVPLILALKKRLLDLGQLQFAVFDECDTLFDDSFRKHVENLLSRFNISKGIQNPINGEQRAQLILASATYPKYATSVLSDIILMENIVSVQSGFLHRISPHVTHQFLRVRPSEKLGEVIRLVEKSMDASTIIFCNFEQSTEKVHQVCQENGIPAMVVTGRTSPKIRKDLMKHFRDGSHNLLITTDLMSRGLDTKLVKHVINFEIPANVSDYLHRCGRVGRVGQSHSGSVTNLVSKKWEVPIVMMIEEAARRRQELIGVSANIKKKHTTRWSRRQALEV